MRLTRIKLAGFKSFVDPTSVHFPSNLTGVVGPNGCGKSNVIDAVRWVMGEISAKQLRGDSMADVIFNGSSARKPVGTASIELVFDNSDGKIGGEYAGYAEVSLKRVVTRDGTSTYLLNGAKCRRKDITQLFLGTGLGSRSYAIIEQGMISRLIEANPDEMRAFLEEAAGISKYKERRRETENRMAHTRENLERLNDLREEVDKQIRHLQRQAATARRYQALKEEERKLTAELLALRLRDLDADREGRERAVAEREIALQGAIAELRTVEAAIEKARSHHAERNEALNEVQSRYYQLGAEAARQEQAIQHARELRQRQRTDLEQAEQGATELSAQLQRDQTLVDELLSALATLTPQHDEAAANEQRSLASLAQAEEAMQVWQQGWEKFTAAVSEAQQRAQVERARIEEIENRLRGLLAQQERVSAERAQLQGQDPAVALQTLIGREEQAAEQGASKQRALAETLEQLLRGREEEQRARAQLDEARATLQNQQGRLVSLEALQQAALGQVQGKVTEWLASHSLAQRPRLAQQIAVEAGWERAVETVLGSYLEAVCVDGLDALAQLIDGLQVGHVTFVSADGHEAAKRPAELLLGKVAGPPAVASLLGGIYAVATLADALARRTSLAAGESIITRDGVWIGRHWLRVSRDRDTHAGVIAREQEMRELRAALDATRESASRLERQLDAARESLAQGETQREQLQGEVNRQHHEHAGLRAQLEALRAKAGETAARIERIAFEADKLDDESAAAHEAVKASRARLAEALSAMEALEARRVTLESERDSLRQTLGDARTQAQADQARAREVAIQLESRRSAQASTLASLERMRAQLDQLTTRRNELAQQLEAGVQPLVEMEHALERALTQRSDVEGELRAARETLEAAEAAMRSLDERRVACEGQVDQARAYMDEARLGAQETRVRREGLAEQFGATHFVLADVLAGLPPEAGIAAWEQSLAENGDRLVRLGSVNLAAIDEFKEQSERKEYLDRAVRGPHRSAQHARYRDPQDRSGNAPALPGHVRSRQRRAQGEIPAPVRRWACVSRDDRRGHPRAPAWR